MESLTIRPFRPGDAAAAAVLVLAARRSALAAYPLLAPGREGGPGSDSPEEAARLAATLAGRSGALAQGARGEIRGFVLAERKRDELWGDSLEIGAGSWALAEGEAGSTLARLYAAAAEEAGIPARQLVSCPALPAFWEPWFRLGFGLEQVYAHAALASMEASCEAPGLEIRRADPGDGEGLEELSSLIAGFQAGAPVWAGAPRAYLEALRQGFRGLTGDKEAIVLLALEGGRILAYQAWFPGGPEPFDAVLPASIELGVGASRPEARGRGIGRALTARGVAEARRAGYTLAFTDWRGANPLASAFWPARGFVAHSYRLVRRLEPRALAEGRELAGRDREPRSQGGTHGMEGEPHSRQG